MKNFKYINYKKVLVSMASLLMLSCTQDFLDITPRGQVIASTTNDYELLLYNNSLFNVASDLIVRMSPEVCAIDQYFSASNLIGQNAFKWEADIYRPIDVPPEISNYVNKLYVYNKIINEVMESTGGNENKKTMLKTEARAGRAWCYFGLINYFGKPYNSQTAPSDPGFPIITIDDVRQNDFVRASVQEVYDFIISDLEAAIPNLPYGDSRLRMSKGAAEALLGKVHVFMGNYSEALSVFNRAFESFDAASFEIGIYDLNKTTLPGGINEPGPFGPAEPPELLNIEIIYHKYFVNLYAVLNSVVLLSPKTAALYDPSDLRFQLRYSNTEFFGPPFTVPNVYRALIPSVNIGIDIKDIYLLRTECKARTNDLAGASKDLEEYRKLRMPEENAAVPTMGKNDLIRFIIDERKREFAVQGVEWFTTRRLFHDPIFSEMDRTHILYNADGSIKETFVLTEDRLQLRFTDKILQENPNFGGNNP